ncbi:hypothetical protein QBC35DRAFT_495143 [Podospora australis]|uniref:N-acetyltransferase domain-containing protein n=1 Tax=Podospora australis TaxID=1536484 RepID=A0AAN7AJH1_9PEZI|nr:hypothetical protein QBC35DRAFT_495143 [Podospora australis]
MGSTESPAPIQGGLLQPINLHNDDEFEELLRQRIICGWHKTQSDIEGWRAAVDDGTREIFWILHPSESLSHHSTVTKRCAGHISIVNGTSPPDQELARRDKSLLYLSSLFVLPEYQKAGLGRRAVQEVERLAKMEPYGSPACQAITIHTASRRYTEDDGEDWRGIYARMGAEPRPRGSSAEDWYARMGYVKWKEQPQYPETLLDGTKIMMVSSFMRKELA